METRHRRDHDPAPTNPDATLRWEHDEVFPGFWRELSALDPVDVCARSGAKFMEQDRAYLLRMLDRLYRVLPGKRTILTDPDLDVAAPPDRRVCFAEALVLVIYLLRSRDVPLSGRRVTEKELPGGALFFRGPHELARQPILSRYGNDPAALLAAGRSLQGEPISFGDAGLRFQVLPRVPVECILWAGDPEFPPSLTYVFDASASDHLPLDTIWALVALLAARLVEAAP